MKKEAAKYSYQGLRGTPATVSECEGSEPDDSTFYQFGYGDPEILGSGGFPSAGSAGYKSKSERNVKIDAKKKRLEQAHSNMQLYADMMKDVKLEDSSNIKVETAADKLISIPKGRAKGRPR